MTIDDTFSVKPKGSIVELIDKTAALLERCRDISEESGLVLIASEAGVPLETVRREYKKVIKNPQALTPVKIYDAAQTVYSMISREIERRAIRPREVVPPKAQKKQKPEKPKKIPLYTPEQGYVGAFALQALVERLIEDKTYKNIGEVDEAVAERKYCNRGVIEAAYNDKRDCTARTYEGLAKLVLEHDGNLTTTHEISIRFLKFPRYWSPTDEHKQGQLVICPDTCTAVVTRKLPHQRIEVKRLDGETRQYKEGMPFSDNQPRRVDDIIKAR